MKVTSIDMLKVLGHDLTMLPLSRLLGVCLKRGPKRSTPRLSTKAKRARHSGRPELATRSFQQSADYFFSQTPFPTTHSGLKSLSWRARVSPTT